MTSKEAPATGTGQEQCFDADVVVVGAGPVGLTLAADLDFGYFYENSPVIAYDGEAAPPYTMGTYTPSTVPGCRAPHFWLPDGRSLYDALGPGYTLLRLRRGADIAALMRVNTSESSLRKLLTDKDAPP